MDTNSEDASQLSSASEELSGRVSAAAKLDEVDAIENTRKRAPVVFLDHDEARFLFPFERCLKWSDFKYLVAEVYAHATEETRTEISKEEFDILTSDDEQILPTIWEYVISDLPLYERGDSSYTVKIRFWTSKLPANVRRVPGPIYTYAPPEPLLSRPERDRQDQGIKRVDSDIAYQDATNDLPRDGARTVRYMPSDEGDMPEVRRHVTRSHSRSRSSIAEEHSEEHDEDNSEDSNADSVTVTEDEDEDEDEDEVEPITILPPPRTAVPPLDREGNPLSFLLDTNWPLHLHESSSTNQITGSKVEETSKSRDIRKLESDNLKILKAVSVTSESRTTIELHTFPGPEGTFIADDINVRWYHLHGDQLDFAQFKDTCLGVQDLPERLRRLVTKTLFRIEKEKLKPFQNGFFIEPGTVLRGDEKHQTSPYSAIFSCIPYFDISSPFNPSSGKSDRLHPPRSLMQSYYPYEPVRERDEEQAFAKFTNGSSNKIIQVPSLWMMNIGTHAVVTCGYRPLSNDFVKSITVVQEDLKAHRLKNGNTLLNVRLTDWEGRVLLYSPAECRSYFEMEQKLRELRPYASGAPATASLQLALNKPQRKKVTPGNWLSIFKGQPNIFIDLSIIDEKEAQELGKKLDGEKTQKDVTTESSLKSIPPFFRWPVPTRTDLKPGDAAVVVTENQDTLRTVQEKRKQDGSTSPDSRHSMLCLEQVEKAMLTETIYEYDAQHVVDKTFTSTKYYQSLPEETYEDVRSNFLSLIHSAGSDDVGSSSHTMHQIVTNTQCAQITTKTNELVETVHATLMLFISDIDQNTMLRKLWGAMKAISAIIDQIDKRCSRKADPSEYTDPEWKAPKTGNRKWTIRPVVRAPKLGSVSTPNPDADQDFIQSIKKCRSCRRGKVYTNPQDALEHLQAHLQTSVTKPPDLKKWIRNDEEKIVEDINAGYLLIVHQASEAVQSLFFETRQLAEGVQIEEGKMSEIYTLPYELLKTLQRLIVFYLAIERAFHHTETSYEKADEAVEDEDTPFSNMGLEVLSRFCESAKTSLKVARMELCIMARATVPEDFSKRLSLGPHYLCSWFMRRLLVKPLNDSMTVADIYREYLSTLQFQVNHRPGKRLLRSINLLQEELAALEQVNVWQTKLIESYTRVLDDATYPIDIPSRRALFQYERLLLDSCIDNLDDTHDDYRELMRRCGPLSESTKQSAEINEEDHGKAIFVFTVVTVIFMPLSFVTSYLGMNTSDIRDMENKQSLFWAIALPLTAVTMGSILFMAYYSDELRDSSSSWYKRLTGKEDTSKSARSISVAQRKRALKNPLDSSSTVDYKSLADEAEFAPPRHVGFGQRINYEKQAEYLDTLGPAPATIAYDYAEPIAANAPEARSGGRFNMAVPTMRLSMPTLKSSMPERFSSPEYARTRPYGHSRLPAQPPLPRPAYNSTKPTYMRVARKYIDVDTLLRQGIPYEIDSTDPDYFILLKYMDESELDMLFESARLTRAITTRRVDDIADFGVEKPMGYDWVNKSRKRHVSGRDGAYGRGGRTRIYIE